MYMCNVMLIHTIKNEIGTLLKKLISKALLFEKANM